MLTSIETISTAKTAGASNAICNLQLRGSPTSTAADVLLLAEMSCAGTNLVQIDVDPLLAPFAASFTGLVFDIAWTAADARLLPFNLFVVRMHLNAGLCFKMPGWSNNYVLL